MRIEMNHNNDLAGFIGGFFATGIYTASILPPNFYSDALGKIIITIIVSVFGGLIGMFTKDLYNQYLQPRVKRFFRKFKK